MSFDRDLRAKEKAKYDDRFLEMESDATIWLTEVLGHTLPGSDDSSLDLCDRLHDGTVLCELANKVIPNATKYKKSAMPFVQMENISQFLSFCSARLQIPQHDLFQTIDLYERKNVFQVVQSIHTFSRYAVQQGGLDARFLGPKMSTSTSRTFTKEQMNEAKNHVNTYQCRISCIRRSSAESSDGKFSGSTNVLFAARRDPGKIFDTSLILLEALMKSIAGHFH